MPLLAGRHPLHGGVLGDRGVRAGLGDASDDRWSVGRAADRDDGGVVVEVTVNVGSQIVSQVTQQLVRFVSGPSRGSFGEGVEVAWLCCGLR